MAEIPPGKEDNGVVLPPADQAAWEEATEIGNAGRYAEALARIEALIDRHPGNNLLMHTAMRIAHNAHDSARAFHAAWALANRARDLPVQHDAWSQMMFWAPFVSELDRPRLDTLGRHWARHLSTAMRGAPMPPPPPRPAGRRLRIGYMSPAFGFPSDYFPLAHHDPERFETFGYSSARQVLPSGAVVPKFGTFRDLAGKLDGEAAGVIREDDIDILVDLGGTGDAQRNGILAFRPARLQVGWSNKLIPQYRPIIDWVIGDPELFATGDFGGEGAARRIALPQAVCIVAERRPQPAPAPPPVLARGHVTFGSTASAYKITDATLALWSRILHRIPDAVFAYSTPFLSDLVERKIRDGFAANGIAPERYSLRVRRNADFPATMNEVDLALDAIPFSSNFSCLQTLRQGVPVITLAGDRLAGRFGASLLRTVGHPELVADTAEDFVARAVALAGDRARLEGYRARLPAAVQQARLDDMRFTADCLERAYERIWELEGLEQR